MGRTKARTARKSHRTLATPADDIPKSKHKNVSNHVSRAYSREKRVKKNERGRSSPNNGRTSPQPPRIPPSEKPPDDQDDFLDSPSAIWHRLSFKQRLISFLIGFLFLYYALFAKHHHYDREIVSIHADVENLIRRANATILRENLVEAELPEIFRETATTLPPVTVPTLATKKTFDPPAIAGEKRGNSALPLKPKKRRKHISGKTKKKKMRRKVLKSTTRANLTNNSDPSINGRAESNASEPNPVPEKEIVVAETGAAPPVGELTPAKQIPGADAPTQSANASSVAMESTSQTSIPSRSSNQPLTSATANVQAAIPTASKGHTTILDTNAAQAAASTGSGQSDADASQNSVSGPATGSMNASPIGTALVSQNQTTGASNPVPSTTSITPPDAPAALERTLQSKNPTTVAVPTAAASSPTKFSAEEEYDYSAEFKDLGLADVPERHVPILDWNYESVINPKTSEQIFGLGNKLDHVGAYQPLCIESETGETVSFTGNRICSGFNRTEGWMKQYCDVMRESLIRENLLKLQPDKPLEWLTEKAAAIHWVEGLSVVQILEKNCGNIAHFSGRALILQHIIDNIAAYAAPPSRIENILILPTYHIMKRFLYPHNYEFWHKSVFNALIVPAKYTIGTLGNFLYREQKIPYSGSPRVQLLHNFSLAGGNIEGKQYVCFRRAIVPGYLKARFFVNDNEYPSKKPSLQSSSADAPVVPRDSLRFRERMSLAFGGTPNFPAMKKEIVLLDRGGTRRVLDNATRPVVLQMFEKVSIEKGYTFKVVSFDHMNFTEQYETMKTIAIAIGIHGANLVNTMFMPPLAVLIELFPFGFLHEMYVNGGNAGIKYYKYQMVSGVPFRGPKQFRTVGQCIKYNRECKIHYRDSALKVTDVDLTAMEQILRQAIAWCDERPKPSDSGASAAQEAPKQRRRRRLLYNGMNLRRKQQLQSRKFTWT